MATMLMVAAESDLDADIGRMAVVRNCDNSRRWANGWSVNDDGGGWWAVARSGNDDRSRHWHMNYRSRCGDDYWRGRKNVTDGMDRGNAG